MKNVMDLLLQMDESKLTKPTRDVEITRLSDMVGEKVVFTCESVSIDKYAEIRENATHKKGETEEVDFIDLQVFLILEGVRAPNLKSEELRSKYKAATPKELAKKMLLPGEIKALYETIGDLSGFRETAVQEIKN